MNGVHDMGGAQGYGPVLIEHEAPLFHAAWEKRALGLTLAMGATGQWNIDQSRSARESLPAATYLSSSYYRIWTLGLERLTLDRGLVFADELAAGHALHPAKPVARVLRAPEVDAALARGTSAARANQAPAHFVLGQRVRAINAHPSGHTRVPRYVRGRAGIISFVHGCHVYADRHAARPGAAPFDDAPEWLYTVVFDGQELWGPQAEAGTAVSVDAWQPYLEAVADGAI